MTYQAKYKKAFILAAGHGTRMRPFTDHTPKPMAAINGETLVERAIDKLHQAGVTDIAVNVHYLADKLRAHIGNRATIIEEDVLLETGGGMRNALSTLGHDNPFYCVSGDSWWEDGQTSVIETMDKAFNESTDDLMLVLQDIHKMHVTKGVGDYQFDPPVRPKRALDQNGSHMWTSIRLCNPRLFSQFADKPIEAFSLLPLMDKAEAEGRLSAVNMSGIWHHVSTMNDIAAVENWLKDKAA